MSEDESKTVPEPEEPADQPLEPKVDKKQAQKEARAKSNKKYYEKVRALAKEAKEAKEKSPEPPKQKSKPPPSAVFNIIPVSHHVLAFNSFSTTFLSTP